MKNIKKTILMSFILMASGIVSQAMATSHEHGHDHDHGNVFTYKQKFMPRQTLKLELKKTAIFITDPQNDFMSESSPIWSLVGEQVKGNKVVDRIKTMKEKAEGMGMLVFYSPHMYTQNDFDNWQSLNGIDKIMFNNKMFLQGTHGHEFVDELKPSKDTIVMNPHKGLSNFWTGDAALQLRERGIDTLIMAGMAANMCVESHARDAVENGFNVIIVADAVAAAGPDALEAALINYEFIGHEVLTTDQVLKRMDELK